MSTLKNFMEYDFYIELWKTHYMQIANYVFKTDSNWDKNLIFYNEKTDKVLSTNIRPDFQDVVLWEEFWSQNERELTSLINPSKFEFESGIAALYIDDMQQINKLVEMYGDKVRKPTKIIKPFYLYYNKDKNIFDWELDDNFYGPTIELNQLFEK